MRKCSLVVILAIAAAAFACSDKMDRTNPFDPKAPKHAQAKSTLKGKVSLEGGAGALSGTGLLLSGGFGNFNSITDSNGNFSVGGVVPGTYDLLITRKGFEEARIYGVELGIGESRDIGEQTLLMLRGSAVGRATMEGLVEHSGITVSMFKAASSGAGLAPLAVTTNAVTGYVSITNPDGSYGLEGLPEGTYSLVAARKDFTPAYLLNITITGGQAASIEAVKLYPVTAVVRINDGARYTNSPAVSLSLFAFNAAEMRVSEDSGFTGISYETFAASKQYGLSSGDGEKTVWAQFKDKFGIVSEKYTAKIVLDTTAPYSAGVTINGGAAYTRSGLVTLGISSADALSGVAKMMLGEDVSFSGAVWEEFNTAKVFSLSAGDGSKVIYAKFMDGAGNICNPVSATITLDSAAPSGNSILINSGALSGNSGNVVLALSSTGASQMMLSNSSSFLGSGWEGFASGRAWALTPGDGARSVYVKFRDEAGNETSSIWNTIAIDTTPPSSPAISVAGGASYTGSSSATLTLGAAGDVTQMVVSESGAFSGASWEAYATSRIFNLTTGDGIKTVYAKYRDNAGNETGVVADMIILDTTAPGSASVEINGGAANTKDQLVTLALSAVGADEMSVGNTATAGDTGWISYGPSGEHGRACERGDNAGHRRAFGGLDAC
jgi:hypothetical protein